MNPSSYPTKVILRLLALKFMLFLRRHWLNVLTTVALVLLLSHKNVQIGITWDSNTFSQKENEELDKGNTSSAAKVKEHTFSLGNFSFGSDAKHAESGVPSPISPKLAAQIIQGKYWSVALLRDQRKAVSLADPRVVSYKTTCENYLKRFLPVAISEMNLFGIPASIKLAQGLLESNAGKAPLATRFHNHFGLQCPAQNCRAGHCASHADLGHTSFYRKHESDWMSYRVHSQIMSEPPYNHLKSISPADYITWAHGLQKAGYSEDATYAEKLIAIIEYFGLQAFDRSS